jgi:DNA-binding CsgD family transcriptional regulator
MEYCKHCHKGPQPPTDILSEREAQVIRLVVQAHGNRHIGHMLGITEKTVKFHLTNIFKKLNLPSRSHLMAAVLTDKIKGSNKAIIGKV